MRERLLAYLEPNGRLDPLRLVFVWQIAQCLAVAVAKLVGFI